MKILSTLQCLVLFFIISSCNDDSQDQFCESLSADGIQVIEDLQNSGIAFFNNPSSSTCPAYNTALENYISYNQEITACVNGQEREDLLIEIDELIIELANLDCDLINRCEEPLREKELLEEGLNYTQIEFDNSPTTMSCTAYKSALVAFIELAPSVTECIPSVDLQSFQFAVSAAEAKLESLDCEQLWIGNFHLGGILGYILQPGDIGYDIEVPHGLIVSPINLSTEVQWGCYSSVFDEFNRDLNGADGFVIGTGLQNQIDFLTGCNDGQGAGSVCAELSLNEYEDWYLPAYDELYALYENKETINLSASIAEGDLFADVAYWSSTESSAIGAYAVHFGDGSGGISNKGSTFYVRAIRSF